MSQPAPENSIKVVLVGHCGADSSMLHWLVQQTLGKVPVTSAHDATALAAYAKPGHVLLINRLLDGSFGAQGGVDLIRQLSSATEKPAMLLISDYPDAQRDAEAAGALPGFGKSQISHPDSAARLRRAAGL